MARRRESSPEVNPYGNLEYFDRQQAGLPAVGNLIDLSSVVNEPSTPGPLASRRLTLDDPPICEPANCGPSKRPSLLDVSTEVDVNIRNTAQQTTNATNSAPLGLNHHVHDAVRHQQSNAIRRSNDISRPDTRPRQHSDLPSYRCDKCRRKGQNRSYCPSCRVIYCPTCWDQQFPHTVVAGSNFHERTDVRVHEILAASLRPDRSESRQKELHRLDESTTWFGVAREGDEGSTFEDHGRFWNIMKETSRKRVRNVYPGLVSFVGNTGAGKSTIIKILIELHHHGVQPPETPVVGSLQTRNCPTSGDVHLYSDPPTINEDYPILYADCEGLEGGEIEPIGSNLNDVDGTGVRRSVRRAYRGSERRITWATTAERQSRQFAVANLYPRFLYTFSDVVVFVLLNGREFENVVKSLLKWAAAALERSSNQPVLPHAIIAHNQSPNELPADDWEINNATRELLNEYRGVIHDNFNFEPYIQFWRRRHRRIDSLEGLLRMYYSSITVINIPTIGRPNLITKQIEKLYDEIKVCCKKSRAAKQSVRMLFTADELHPYLVSAFDHFATNLDEPFDFVQFSFMNSPIPQDFAGSIVKLAMAMNVRKKHASMINIFQELSFIVASCIMLDAARNRKIGTAEAIFPNYLGHCDDALEDFCDRSWPCEFRSGQDRCVNVRAGHQTAKGHQRKDGRVIGKGDYLSECSPDTFRHDFRDMIYNNLQQLLEKLGQMRGLNTTEAQDAAEIHSKSILQPFFQHLGLGENFKSRLTCFCCLTGLPEHPLPCGHVLCTPCVRSYGQLRGQYRFEMTHCPLESHRDRFGMSCQILFKPPTAGVRVLTLDGGGIRAVVELELLRILKDELGGKIPLRDFFDLIVGTNTGGLIALDLALIDEHVNEDVHHDVSQDVRKVTSHFETFCDASFTYTNMFSGVPFVSKPRYHTKPLEDVLKKIFKQTYAPDRLFGWSPERATLQTKVAVTSSLNTGKTVVISNYNRAILDDGSYTFRQPDQAAHELKVWEARARATVTIPTIFRNFTHSPSNLSYRGSNPEHINPVEVADTERKLKWPDTEHSPPDIIISIGAGYDASTRLLRRVSMWRPKSKPEDRDILDPSRSGSIAQDTWEHYLDSLPSKLKDDLRYVRLNVPVDSPIPKLDDVEEMKSFQQQIKRRLRNVNLVRPSRQIIASCFFFDIIQPPTQGDPGGFVCKGSINCRFSDANIRRFGEYFNENRLGNYPFFSIQERDSQHGPQCFPFPADLMESMIEGGPFNIGPVDVRLGQKVAIVEIVLVFGDGQSFPISGFPRHLLGDETRSMRLQQDQPSRWRPADREVHRQNWTGPSSTRSKRPTCNLSQYASPDYVFGETKISFNVSELPDQPIRGFRAEMDGGRRAFREPEPSVGRSALHPRRSTNGQHASARGRQYPSVEASKIDRGFGTEVRQHRRDDSMSEVTASRRQGEASKPNGPGGVRPGGRRIRGVSLDEQPAITRHHQPVADPSCVADRPRANAAHDRAVGTIRPQPIQSFLTKSTKEDDDDGDDNDNGNGNDGDPVSRPRRPPSSYRDWGPPLSQADDRLRGGKEDINHRRRASANATSLYHEPHWSKSRQPSEHGSRDRDRGRGRDLGNDSDRPQPDAIHQPTSRGRQLSEHHHPNRDSDRERDGDGDRPRRGISKAAAANRQIYPSSNMRDDSSSSSAPRPPISGSRRRRRRHRRHSSQSSSRYKEPRQPVDEAAWSGEGR